MKNLQESGLNADPNEEEQKTHIGTEEEVTEDDDHNTGDDHMRIDEEGVELDDEDQV